MDGVTHLVSRQFGGSRVGIVNFDRGSCPYNLSLHWRHSVGGKLQTDESLRDIDAIRLKIARDGADSHRLANYFSKE